MTWAGHPSTGHTAQCASSPKSCAEGSGRLWGPPGHLVPSCQVPYASGHVHTMSPTPVSPVPPPALTSQRCLELVLGAVPDPSSGLSSTALRAARRGAELTGSGWHLAGTEPAGRDRVAVAKPHCPGPPVLQGTAQPSWGQGHAGGTGLGTPAVPERGRGSGCSGSGSGGAAWPPPSWLCSCARSCSEKERSRFSGTSAPGESSSCNAMATTSPPCPPSTSCVPPLHPPAPPRPLSRLRDVHLLHLGQCGRLEQDAWPWSRWRGAAWAVGELEAGAGGQAAGAGLRDAGQGAVPCRGTQAESWFHRDLL